MTAARARSASFIDNPAREAALAKLDALRARSCPACRPATETRCSIPTTIGHALQRGLAENA